MQQKEFYLEYPADRVVPISEIVTRKLNYYNSILVERLCQYHEAVNRFNANQSLVIVTGMNNMGQPITMSIYAICQNRLASLEEIISLRDTTEKVLKSINASIDDFNTSYLSKDSIKLPNHTMDLRDIEKDSENEGGTPVAKNN